MKVLLRVHGQRLLARVAAEIARKDSAFPRQLSSRLPLQWQVDALPAPMGRVSLDKIDGQATVALIEVDGTQRIDELWSMSSRDYHALALQPRPDPACAPVILVLERDLPTAQLLAMPAIVSDWVIGLDAMQDLARRICAAIRRRSPLADDGDSARLSLQIETRMLCYAGDTIQLTPSEVAVAELFLTHFASTIPLDDILLLFKLAGRSIEGSNVRVTMFQLRFKIEALTHCRYTLTSAYGHGYVLNYGKAGEAGRGTSNKEARQQVR